MYRGHNWDQEYLSQRQAMSRETTQRLMARQQQENEARMRAFLREAERGAAEMPVTELDPSPLQGLYSWQGLRRRKPPNALARLLSFGKESFDGPDGLQSLNAPW